MNRISNYLIQSRVKMNSFYFSLFVLLIGSVSLAIPKPEEKKERVLQRDLSDKKHYQDAEHNLEYDHEAFLGQEAKTFDQLSPDESKRRLGLIVDKIDKDHDGFVSQDELKNWMEYTQKKYIQDDVEKQWKVHVTPDQNELSWETYKKNFYGFMEDIDYNNLDKNEDGYSYNYIIKRDRRRWDIADEDGNNALNKEEFLGFLHPEEIPHMKDVVVLETMEDIDKDQDGKISLKEYIGDIYKGEDEEPEPDWVKNEREQFATYRDKNKDGFLDEEEVKSWIIPPDFDHAEAEARHLIYESDSDSDQKLTKAEILAKYNLFVGSQATDFGEALTRHDEF